MPAFGDLGFNTEHDRDCGCVMVSSDGSVEVTTTPTEIDFSVDIQDWANKLTDNEKFYIKQILAFFAASDGIVNENIAVNFLSEVQYSEAKAYYTFPAMIEVIHPEVYSLSIDVLVPDPKEKNELLNAIDS